MLHSIDKESVESIGEDADLLTMGITPSGRGVLHMGHFLTVFNVLRSLARFKDQKAQIFIDDREFNSQVVPAVPEEMVTLRVEDQLRQFIADVTKFLAEDTIPQRVDLTRMSDFYLQNGAEAQFMGKDLFDLLLSIRAKVGKAFPKMKIGGISGVRALCPKCHQGKSSFRGAARSYNDDKIVSSCENNECGDFERDYEVNIGQGDTNWAIFYTLVGLRDVSLLRRDNNKGILHVYGGDYGVPWGRGYVPKGRRISSLVDDVLGEDTKERIDHFVGPILVTKNGEKLSKSSGNGADIKFDLETLARILDRREGLVKI